MSRAQEYEPGTILDDIGNTSNSQQHVTAPYNHHTAFNDMINTDVVNEDDAKIAQEEARMAYTGEYDSQGFPINSLSMTNTLSDPPSYESGMGGKLRCHAKLMRKREHGTKVTNMELFFDLVFVYAISVISETMVEDLTWEVVLEMLLVTLAVWWAWVFSAWTFNWFNPDSYLVRLLLMSLMLVSLVMSAVIAGSFTNQSLLFAGMYVLIQVGRTGVSALALHGHKLQCNYLRILVWFSTSAVLWLVGGAIGGTTRNVLWIVAIVLEYLSPALGFYTPGLGKSFTSDWNIHGGHLAERCSLFIIIALGESIVVTGEAFQQVIHEPAGVGMFIVSFVGATSMWWIYFHTASAEATEHVEHSDDPGEMGRLGYTYIHVILVVGIIWSAVADRISMEDPYMVPHDHEDGMIKVAIMIGGPALFVLGHAMFRRTFSTRLPAPHLIAVAAMICATSIGIFLPLWATALTTTTILLMLGFYESYFRCVILPGIDHGPS